MSGQAQNRMNKHQLRFADVDHPLAIFVLIDLSSHTFDETPIRGMTRIQFIEQTVRNVIRTSLDRCRKVIGFRPRHHLSIICYHSFAFDIPIPLPADHMRMNNQRNPANIDDHIYPIGIFANIRLSFAPYRTHHATRNTAAAFRYVAEKIARNAYNYHESHPPIVIHFSSGLPDDITDLEDAYRQLTTQYTNYGATLIHNVFVGEHLCGPDQHDWQGITDRTSFSTPDARTGYTLLAVTSRIPSAYQSVIHAFFPTITFPSDYFFIPGMIDTRTYWDAFIIGNNSYMYLAGQ